MRGDLDNIEAGRVISTGHPFRNLDGQFPEETGRFHQRHASHIDNRVHLKDHLPGGVADVEEALAYGDMLGPWPANTKVRGAAVDGAVTEATTFRYLIRVRRGGEICPPWMLTSPS